MDVVVAGGHGQIAMLLHPMLTAQGDHVRALIRNPDQADEVAATGAVPVVCDLQDEDADVETAVSGADAFVFAAGAGPGSGPARKRTMDLGGVLRTVAACAAAGVDRYVVVSAIGADPDAPDDGAFGSYLRAKGDADRHALASGLDVTVVRPVALTNEAPTGRVRIAQSTGRGSVPRADVAAVVAAVLAAGNLSGRSFDLTGGDTEIATALQAYAEG